MKLWKRAGSVGLSLALCAGLASPALAHTVVIEDQEGPETEVDTVQKGVEMIEGSWSRTGTIEMTGDEPEAVLQSVRAM